MPRKTWLDDKKPWLDDLKRFVYEYAKSLGFFNKFPEKEKKKAKKKVGKIVENTLKEATKKKKPKEKIKISLSPGHWGKRKPDSGAIGLYGTTEADIAYRVAVLLEEQMNATRQFDVKIQKGNYSDRIRKSNTRKDKYYIPIHFNAIDLLGDGKITEEVEGKKNGWLLFVYKQEKKRMALARSILDVLNKKFKLGWQDWDKVKDGIMVRKEGRGAYEIKTPNAITLFLELGFISNPFWEKKLMKKNTLTELARCITLGFSKFLQKN
jgi:N-acetylmuramoyl-L-alanine amidase